MNPPIPSRLADGVADAEQDSADDRVSNPNAPLSTLPTLEKDSLGSNVCKNYGDDGAVADTVTLSKYASPPATTLKDSLALQATSTLETPITIAKANTDPVSS